MSISVSFAKTSKRRNSTLQATFNTSFDCVLKAPTSLDKPTFLLSASSFDYNLAHFEGRYYFVDDIVSVRNGQFEVSCILDVLATYKTEILASTQYVCYSSVSGGQMLADTRIPVLKSATVATSSSAIGILSTTGHYILSVVGKNSAATYQVSLTNIKDILDSISDWQDVGIQNAVDLISASATEDFSGVSDTLATIGEALVNSGFVGNAYSQAPSCLRSCIWVPFSTILHDGTDIIYLGNFNTHVQAKRISSSPTTGSASVSIPWQFTDWRRATCEEVYLYLPLVGMINIPSDEIVGNSSITINYSCTATDGCIAYELEAGSQVIGTFGANCSANYPIGINQQASAGEIMQSFVNGIEKTLSAGVNSSISPISAGAATAEMIFQGAVGAYDLVNTSLSSHASCVGGIGGGAGVGLSLSAKCFTVAHPTVISPASMAATMGLPTMKPMTLSSLMGFCQCANAHVSAPAQAAELDAIDAYLNSGFYIE